MHVILYQPEIPPNTGNVIRLCANTGAQLHLIAPLGFALDNAKLRRAGLDYHEYAAVRVHADLAACLTAIGGHDSTSDPVGAAGGLVRMFALSTRGTVRYDTPQFGQDDAFLFGPETRGLPPEVLAQVPESRRLHVPMRPLNRSLNLSNAVAVVLFEAWRQTGFPDAAPRAPD
jgi:tRNA (cytidine/uridine-2'-O-)-methyltransferase